MINQKRSQF